MPLCCADDELMPPQRTDPLLLTFTRMELSLSLLIYAPATVILKTEEPLPHCAVLAEGLGGKEMLMDGPCPSAEKQ